MKGLLKAIRNTLRALRRGAGGMIRKTIEIGGKLVSVLVPGPAVAPEPDYADYEVPEIASPSDKEEHAFEHNVYAAAVELLGGGDLQPETAEKLTPAHVRWLAVMPDDMLKRVLCSQPHHVHDHLRNKRSIKGVLRFEKEAVDAYIEAMARQPVEEQEWQQQRAPAFAMAFS